MANSRIYIGATVTLTNADTNYNLMSLVQGVLDAETGIATGGVCPGACRELFIQSANGNTAPVLIGDGKLSATRVGYELKNGSSAVGDSRLYRSTINNVDLASLFARSGTSGQKLNIEIVLA